MGPGSGSGASPCLHGGPGGARWLLGRRGAFPRTAGRISALVVVSPVCSPALGSMGDEEQTARRRAPATVSDASGDGVLGVKGETFYRDSDLLTQIRVPSYLFKIMQICDSHIEFIHHQEDISDPKVLSFISGQINPKMINNIQSGLFFLATYVEPSDNAYVKAKEVISNYIAEVEKNDWNIVLSKKDIKSDKINIILHLEDAFCVGANLNRIGELHKMGIRSIGLTHNKKNQFSSGALEGAGGLTELGQKAIKKIIKSRMILDFAHLSEKSFFEVTGKFKVKPFISHCGIRALLDSSRNISDCVLEEIAKRDGYIGVGCAGSFLSKSTSTLEDYVSQVKYAQKKCGVSRVGLGSDFGGIISSVPKRLEDISKINNLKKDLPGRNFYSKSLSNFLSSIDF